MKRVTGVGGVFFKCRDSAAARDWYRKHLGIESEEWGFSFMWREHDNPDAVGYTVWSPHQEDTKRFGPPENRFMFNYRVADLGALIEALREEGVEIVGEIEDHENGRFAWILDGEGNKVELWEPVPSKDDPYL